MAQLGGRLAMKHPVAVFAPADRPGPRQAAHGGGDGLALRADEVGEALVTKRQRDDDAVGVDAAPPLGEMPERQEQPIVDTLMVGDRERHREVMGSSRPAVEQLQPELRPRDDAHDELVIEDSKPGRLEDHPADLRAHVGALVVPSPGAHHVAMSDELHAAPAEDVDRAAEQTVDDQEAAMVLGRLVRGRRVPLAG